MPIAGPSLVPRQGHTGLEGLFRTPSGDETHSANMSTISSGQSERTIAAVFLIIIVGMQIASALTRAVQNSDGRCGRCVYYVAFVINVAHELFIGIAVPVSLVWTAHELLVGERGLDALLAAIVGSLWYGPERVQNSIANLCNVCTRKGILLAAIGKYHRIAMQKGVNDETLTEPLRVTRMLRFAPWWSWKEKKADKYWNGRVKKTESGHVVLRDVQLRAIARQGIVMALSGEYDESKLRYWCAGMIADQARFAPSKLQSVNQHENWALVLDGYEGKYINQSFEEHKIDWSLDERKRLGTVADGIRKKSLRYVREQGWLD